MSSNIPTRTPGETLFPPRARTEGGSLSLAGSSRPSFAQPGSFNTELSSAATIRPDLASLASYRTAFIELRDDSRSTEQRQADYKEKIEREMKIKTGTENLLDALNAKGTKQSRDQRAIVESELNQSNRKIAQLRQDLAAEIQRAKEHPPPPQQSRLSQLFKSSRARSPIQYGEDQETDQEQDEESDQENESPTYVLSNLLQSLEALNMPPAYYVERANSLVALFERHPTLKYDLVWSIFGLRIQSLLLSDSREVAAAGYRVLRYSIKDRRSLTIIRSLHTDYLVILSLVKDSKATVEREQALKFVRAFLDVPGGIKEISTAIVRTITSIAEHPEDRMRNMCILTLAEILVRQPVLALEAGGIGVLTEALSDGSYRPAESLAQSLVYLLDWPESRRHFRSGHEIDGAFAAFSNGTIELDAERLKRSARVISSLLRSWAGLTMLSADRFRSIQSLMASLYVPSSITRDTILELIMDVLRIKAPSWSSSFLAGRRLTTYGRVTNLQAGSKHASNIEVREDLVEHFVAVLLAILIQCNVVESLLHTIREEPDPSVKRKATLLLGEVLNMASQSLPADRTARLHILPTLFSSAAMLKTEERHISSSAIYQIDSVNRTLLRSSQKNRFIDSSYVEGGFTTGGRRLTDPLRDVITSSIEEAQFRTVILESQVLSTVNYTKWKWEMIEQIIDGPLQNQKRFDECLRTSKFIKRVLDFYRPFRYRFCEIRNTKPNQRYVRIGCSLMRTMLVHPEGVKYMAENKVLRQLAECLAQVDRLSGLTSSAPLFAVDRILDTLTHGYFAMIGTLSADPKGLLMLERWKMFNMFYHIIELQDRDDLVRVLLTNLDYSADSHLRIILSKSLTTCSKSIRIACTRLLRKYAINFSPSFQVNSQEAFSGQWAVDFLITQLYDPDIEVCEAAIKILEQACMNQACLEFVVERQPALDHLGEIGAPLLLKFLSNSNGYRYLAGLDYITQEMEDWYLGRNDSYVLLAEAALTKALWTPKDKVGHTDDLQDPPLGGIAPPHFYRELTRTREGCSLLIKEGHFDGFVDTIRSWDLERKDAELLLKVKGAMWAVGNIGSMEFGASFLESTDVIQMIIRIAETSEVISLRGTALYVLGLISRSVYGQEILAEHGWDATTDDTGMSVGICLPTDLSKLFNVPMSRKARGDDPTEELPSRPTVVHDRNKMFSRVLSLVKDLNNTVLTKRRAAELHTIKTKNGGPFRSTRLFIKAMKLLEKHHYRLPIIRFVIDLFDKQVMRRIVYDEAEEEEELDDDDDDNNDDNDDKRDDGSIDSSDDET